MIRDSVVDLASGKVTSALPKEVLNSPDYSGQLTVLLVTITNDPTPAPSDANTTATPRPPSSYQTIISTTPVSHSCAMLYHHTCES